MTTINKVTKRKKLQEFGFYYFFLLWRVIIYIILFHDVIGKLKVFSPKYGFYDKITVYNREYYSENKQF